MFGIKHSKQQILRNGKIVVNVDDGLEGLDDGPEDGDDQGELDDGLTGPGHHAGFSE